MLEARIQQHLFETADLIYQVADALAPALMPAVHALTGSLTAGGKVLIAAPDAAALAHDFAAALLTGFERERPPLAALVLADGAPGLTQVRALGHPGDALLVCTACCGSAELAALIDTAHAHELHVVLLCGPGDGPALAETDVRVSIPHPRAARVRELQLLALHALADAIDLHLMGVETE